MKHVCRRCLTAFSSQGVLNDHVERCIKQQPTNIAFSYKDNLRFEDHYMKKPVPKKVIQNLNVIIIFIDYNPDNPNFFSNKFHLQKELI